MTSWHMCHQPESSGNLCNKKSSRTPDSIPLTKHHLGSHHLYLLLAKMWKLVQLISLYSILPISYLSIVVGSCWWCICSTLSTLALSTSNEKNCSCIRAIPLGGVSLRSSRYKTSTQSESKNRSLVRHMEPYTKFHPFVPFVSGFKWFQMRTHALCNNLRLARLANKG